MVAAAVGAAAAPVGRVGALRIFSRNRAAALCAVVLVLLIALAAVAVDRTRVAGVSSALGWLTVGILGTAVYAARSPELLVPASKQA